MVGAELNVHVERSLEWWGDWAQSARNADDRHLESLEPGREDPHLRRVEDKHSHLENVQRQTQTRICKQ